MTAIEHELSWGAIMLSQVGSEELSDAPYEIYAHSPDEADFGNPEAVIEIVRALLTDGSVAIKTGHTHRTIRLLLAIEGDDGESLAVGESLLMTEVLADQPAALRWQPPAIESAPCNFDVQVADLARAYSPLWVLREGRHLVRFFILTLTCSPWVRPDDPVVIEAVPLAPETAPEWTDVDTCGSITDWSRETDGGSPAGPTASTISGETAITVSARIDSATDYLRAVRHFSTPLAVPSGEYLAIDARISRGDAFTGAWKIHDGTTHRDPVAVVAGAGEGGSTRLYFANLPASVSDLKILFDYASVVDGDGDMTYLSVFNVAITDQIVVPSSTARQQIRSLDVLGSAPTTAALRLFTDEAADDLGSTVLIYTAADEGVFPPPLRAHMDATLAAAATVDATVISGAYNSLAADLVYYPPASLLPDATYSLVAQMRRTAGATTRTIEWTAKVVDDTGADVFGSETVASGSQDVTLSDTAWHPVSLASLSLPVVKLDDGTNRKVKITLHIDSNGSEVLVDENWLMDTDRGAYTLLDLPATADLSWVEVRSPELDSPLPAVFGGTGGSAQEAGQDIGRFVKSFGIHRFLPGPMLVFTACSGSTRSQSDGRLYPRFHSHVVYGSGEE